MSSEWGPAAWKFLHIVSFSYPDNPSVQETRDAEALFWSLKNLLPCQACREHYESELELHPPDTRSRLTLSSWLVDVHNRVNQRLQKPLFSYADAEKIYGGGQCATDCGRSLKVISRESTAVRDGLWGLMVLAVIAIYLAIIFRKKFVK